VIAKNVRCLDRLQSSTDEMDKIYQTLAQLKGKAEASGKMPDELLSRILKHASSDGSFVEIAEFARHVSIACWRDPKKHFQNKFCLASHLLSGTEAAERCGRNAGRASQGVS